MQIYREFRPFSGLLAVLFLLASPNFATATPASIGLGTTIAPRGDMLEVEITDRDTGTELQSVSVSIQSLDGTEAYHSTLSNRSGRAQVSGLNASSTYRVEIELATYTTTTLFTRPGLKLQIAMRPTRDLASAAPTVRASGVIRSWPSNPRGIQAGLVFSSLSASDLLGFGVEALISEEDDIVNIYGDRKIPSNMVLPDQRLPILLGRARLNKPVYRLPFKSASGSMKRLTSIQGEISSSDILFNGGESYKILNKTRFKQLGISSPFALPTIDFSRDLDAPLALQPASTLLAPVPPFRADVLAVSLLDLAGDRHELILTDVKLAREAGDAGPAKPVTLVAPSRGAAGEASQHILSVALPESGKELSGIFSTAGGSPIQPARFRPAPKPASGGTLTLQAPSHGIAIAFVDEPGRTERTHEVFVLPSAGHVAFSPVAPTPGSRYITLELELGATFAESSIAPTQALATLEAFSRNAGTF
jgi:hypothetical protein